MYTHTPSPPQKHHPIFFAKPSFKSANYPSLGNVFREPSFLKVLSCERVCL